MRFSISQNDVFCEMFSLFLPFEIKCFVYNISFREIVNVYLIFDTLN